MEAILFQSKKSSEQPLWQQRLLLAQSPLQLITEQSPLRKQAECFIANRFFERYGARLEHYMPLLLTSIQAERIEAGLGFQLAASQALFLEQYLDKPIESLLPRHCGQISREAIVEIGNLAASFQARSPLLFIVITAILDAAGFRYVVFTATREVRRLLKKLQLTTDVIGLADPALLPDKGQSWGSYYQHQPIILGGSLPDAVQHLRQHNVIRAALEHHADFIATTADKLRLS
ncbi:MAG: thermostable hemolysin [Methylophaga sp.]|nr:thermostable hemolysin [Methylophaga sp.]